MKKVFVKTTWIPFESGGRKQPPEGQTYVAVCRFKDQSLEDWKKNAWSLRLEFLATEETQTENFSYAFASFLAEAAPHYLLTPNTDFELYEGPNAVAQVQVLLSEKLIEKLVAHAV